MPVSGDILKELRKEKKITQEKMGLLFGISRSSYANYESGVKRMPISMLEMLADTFHVSTDYILGRTAISKPYAPRKPK